MPHALFAGLPIANDCSHVFGRGPWFPHAVLYLGWPQSRILTQAVLTDNRQIHAKRRFFLLARC